MKITGIHHVTFIVDDKQKAAWFYGDLLQLPEKGRPSFDFPGLFYLSGKGQEIHLICAARMPKHDELVVRWGSGREMSLRHVHRHAALRVSDIAALEQRLTAAGVKILFSESLADIRNEFDRNLLEGWQAAYGGIPIFCEDPFGNLLEFVPLE